MAYILNTADDRRAMLAAIGAGSFEELLASIPGELRLSQSLDLPDAMSEMELTGHLGRLAARTEHAGTHICFLGGGSYDHFIPAVVDAIASRTEFYSSYTPYQPEVSQGNLQAMFEYQTMICQLTGMDVSNASLYDGGSAAVEAVLLSMSVTRRGGKVVIPASLHPEYLQVLRTYLAELDTRLVVVPTPTGQLAPEALDEVLDDQVACVLLQHPNFFGGLEDVQAIADRVHRVGGLLVHVFDPISLGLLKRPGDLGADVAVAEGQSLGIPMQFGGPYLGVMACRERFVRRLPGRIAGQTVDRRGRRCWVLTLQTREQHIRRDKATSNICTNQGLMALRATVYLSWLGPHGLRDVAELCVRKTRYAAERISRSSRYELKFAAPSFKEFVLRDRQNNVDGALAAARAQGILAGIPLARWYPELDDCLLVAVTEQRTADEIHRWAASLA